MPIDPNIYAQLRPAPLANPFDLFKQAQEMQALQEQRGALATLRQQQVTDLQTQQADRARKLQQQQQIDQVMQGALTKDSSTGMQTYDRGKLMTGMTQIGIAPDQMQAYLKVLDDSDAQITKARGAQADALKSVATLVDHTGNDPIVFKNEVQRAIANGLVSPQLAQPYLDAVARDPRHVSTITGALLNKQPELMDVAPSHTVIDKGNPQAGAVYTAPPAELTPAEAANLKIEEARLGETMRHNRAVENDGINADDPAAQQAAEVMGQFLAKTGSMPAGFRVYGKDSAKFYTNVAASAQRYASANGLDLAQSAAGYKANQASLTQQTKSYDAVQSFLNTADQNGALLEEAIKKVPDTGIPIFNRPLRDFARGVQGDPNMSQVATYLASVQNEYAKILTNPNLSGQLTDSARKDAQALVSGSQTVQQMVASLRALRKEGGNRLANTAQQIQTIQHRIGGSTAPSAGTIYAKDPQGNVHSAPAGTPLPDGWQQVSGPGGTP